MKKSKLNKINWSKREISFVESKYRAGYSRREISKMFNHKFNSVNRTPDSIKHCLDVYCQDAILDLPKVLYIDVETAPAEAYVWQQYDNNIDLPMLKKDGSILSWCAKWAGDKELKAMYKDMRGKEKNLDKTKELIKPLWKLMDKADIVIWHNGNKFDKGKINVEFIKNNLGAPSEYKSIDTLLLARSTFNFFSNKLAFLTKKLRVSRIKGSHGDFPGFSLWDQCMKGNIKAWNSMKTYNIIDVVALEMVFKEMAPYIKNNRNVASVLRVYEALNQKKVK
jgi:hypothetical protein